MFETTGDFLMSKLCYSFVTEGMIEWRKTYQILLKAPPVSSTTDEIKRINEAMVR